jgi:crotonobetaine/carnitine-CoA ligase
VDLVGNRTLRDLLTERAQRQPDKICLVHEARTGEVREFTYAELLTDVQAAAGGFAHLGVGPGDKVVLHLASSPEFVIAWFGLTWLGAVAVPSNTANTVPEMQHVLTLSDAVGYVTSPEYAPVLAAAAESAPAVRVRLLARAGDGAGTPTLESLLAAGHPAPVHPVDSEDVAQLLFTSGTTSRPKAVMLTHANCLHAGERESRMQAVDETDRLLTALPTFHVNAQTVSLLSAFTAGATVVLLEEYRATRFIAQVRAHRATALSLVGTQVRTLLLQPPHDQDQDHRVRRCLFALNVLDSEKDAFEKRYGIELMNGYGLSEAMTIVSVNPVFGERRWPSIGLPASDRTVRLIDADGNDVPTGTVGELIVHGVPGRTLMKGYYKDPEATAATVRDGWLYTGDNAYSDEAGYLYFFDRLKDVIKRAGENISATEVESALLEHPDIAEAAVIGITDPIRDEAVKAYVVAREGSALTVEQVIAHCRAFLAPFKVPTVVEVRGGLPRTSVGKIEKKTLRAEARAAGELH